MEIRLIATQIGDRLKYDTSVNEINRVGQSILKVNKETFGNDSITSVRASEIYNWIMTLGKTSLTSEVDIPRKVYHHSALKFTSKFLAKVYQFTSLFSTAGTVIKINNTTLFSLS